MPCIAVAAKPCVPAAARIRSFDQALVLCLLCKLPCRGPDGDYHLDLCPASPRHSEVAGDLSIISLCLKECAVIVARDAVADVCIDKTLVRSAFQPDAAIRASFNQHRRAITRQSERVGGEKIESRLIPRLMDWIACPERDGGLAIRFR